MNENKAKYMCEHCEKGYKIKKRCNEHEEICKIKYLCKKSDIKKELDKIDENLENLENTITYSQLVKFVIQLNNKVEKLEETIKKHEKQKISITEYLNTKYHLTNPKPIQTFNQWINNLFIQYSDIEYLFENSFIHTLENIITRELFEKQSPTTVPSPSQNTYPLFASSDNTKKFYYYENMFSPSTSTTAQIQIQIPIWQTADSTNNIFKIIFGRIYHQMIKTLFSWGELNGEKRKKDENIEAGFQTAMHKITNMNVDTNQNQYLFYIKKIIHKHIKKEIKTVIEYDFE